MLTILRLTGAATVPLLIVLGVVPAHATTDPSAPADPAPSTAATYCVIVPPIEYQGQPVFAGGEYCVPGP